MSPEDAKENNIGKKEWLRVDHNLLPKRDKPTELLEEVATSIVEYEALRYTAVQIDNKIWQKIQYWLKAEREDILGKLGAALIENKQLKAQLKKAKCCGSCKWWRWWDWYDQMQCCDCKDSEWYQKSVCPDNKCKKWEVQK